MQPETPAMDPAMNGPDLDFEDDKWCDPVTNDARDSGDDDAEGKRRWRFRE